MAAYTDPEGNVYNTDDFEIVSSADGTFNINMQPSLTDDEDLKCGQYVAKVEMWYTNAQFESGYEVEKVTEKLFILTEKIENE
jgi:hypothetical protein